MCSIMVSSVGLVLGHTRMVGGGLYSDCKILGMLLVMPDCHFSPSLFFLFLFLFFWYLICLLIRKV